MANPINIHEAKTHFSRLVERVEAGEELVIARAGRPVAMLVPIPARTTPRMPGQLKGKIRFAGDWDSPAINAEIAALFDA
jgi:prevent-host-death family protein